MTDGVQSEARTTLTGDLRKIGVFADLDEEQIAWLADHLDEIRLQAGEVFGQKGDPIEHLVVILDGEIRFERFSSVDTTVLTVPAGQVTGLLPYSRLTHMNGTGRAVLPTRIARLHKSLFPEMLARIPVLGQRLVSLMADRIRETTRLETQREKLAALGKLSAGLAHELNNPAAAAQRAASSLRETLLTVRDASIRLSRHALSSDKRDIIFRFETEAGQYVAPLPPDPLEQSDREERVTSWLENRGVPEAWRVAPALAEAGVDAPNLDGLAAEIGDAIVADAVTRIASILTIARLIKEIEISSHRISDLVRAIKEYSYMDQAPMQEVDVHQGIENTLTILHHNLKRGVEVNRQYAPDLPRICAYGGELNQIWTNVISNAIEAMQGKGELRVRTARDLDRILVEIGDNGPGIPPDVQPHIFDPFFTTKGVGEGTGLGLDTVCRIIRNHHGEIRVQSQPGDTRFQIFLPIAQPKGSPISSTSE